jgi:hypothetical protein
MITWGLWIILSSINIASVCLVALTAKVRSALGARSARARRSEFHSGAQNDKD